MQEMMILLNREPAILACHHTQQAISSYQLDADRLTKGSDSSA
jgi:hypothetical protein